MTTSLHRDRVGVLVPTFNRLHYLRESLGSVLAQNHGALDVIVIDNGSTDGTREHMASVRDGRVRYIVNPADIGLAGSVNKGVSEFAGDVRWCTVLCDDDIMEPDFVRAALDHARAVSATSVVDSRRLLIDEHGQLLRRVRSPAAAATALEYLGSRARFVRETFLSGILFHREAFSTVGGYPCFATGAGTDDAFIFAMALLGDLHCAREASVRIRIHRGAETNDPSRVKNHFRAVSEMEAFIVARADASPRLGHRERLWVRRAAASYAAMSRDILWSRLVGILLAAEDPGRELEIAEMISLARGGGNRFTARTRANAFLLRRTGRLFESFLPYRLFWQVVKLGRILLI